MTRTLIAAALLLTLTTTANAQSRVHEKDLTGTWKLVVDLNGETQNADNALARIALKAAGGLMDEIDVRFEFQAQHRLKVTARVFGEDEDEEISDWSVNDRGQLIMGDSEHVNSENTVWMFVDGHLVAFELKDDKLVRSDNVRLERQG